MGSIKKKKLADAVIEEIRRMIHAGELKKGDKLPNQSDFASQLGVSRPSLREALNTLMLLGAIEQRPGFGTVLLSEGPLMFTEHLSPPLVSDRQATLELIESRRLIEVDVAELAAINADGKDIQRLGVLVKDMKAALGEGRTTDYTDLDLAFHYQVAEASRNRFMIHMFVTIRGLMEQFMRESFSLLPGMYERSLKFHLAIYDGLKQRDQKMAGDSMNRHIQDVERGIRQYYKVALPSGN